MQRRAQREALTPQKLKRDEWLLSNSSLSLEEKKKKILKNLSRLEALGLLQAPHSHTQILHLIAKVTNQSPAGREGPTPPGPHETLWTPQDIRQRRVQRQRRGAELQRLAQTLARLEAKSCFHSQQVDYYRDYITSCLDNLTANRLGILLGRSG